jgi:hypothetical protein
MTRLDRHLARQLALALAIKLALLAALWWVFVRPVHVDVSAERLAAQIGAPVPVQRQAP